VSRAAKKHQTIASSKDFVEVAKGASWSNPAHTVWFEQSKHRDVNSFLSRYYRSPAGYKNTEDEKVYLADIRWLNYGIGEDQEGKLVSHPNQVWYRTSFDKREPWKKIDLKRRNSEEDQASLSDAEFALYDGPLELKKEKAKDLHSLATKFLPAGYQNLYPAPESAAESSSEEEEDEKEREAEGTGEVAGNQSDDEEDVHDQSDDSQDGQPARKALRAAGKAGGAANHVTALNLQFESMIVYDGEGASDTVLLGHVMGVTVNWHKHAPNIATHMHTY
jgi:hypothetical protein